MPKFTVEIYKSNSYGMTILEQILAGLQQKFTGVDTCDKTGFGELVSVMDEYIE